MTEVLYWMRIQRAVVMIEPVSMAAMEGQIEHLPEQTRYTIRMLLELLDQIQQRIDALERRMRTVFGDTPEVQRLMTLPGIALRTNLNRKDF